MLKHVLNQTAPLPRRSKCQHDEGEDSNAVLSQPHCLVDTKGEAGVMNVQQRQTHISTCLHLCVRERVAIYLAGRVGVGSGNPIWRCLLVDRVEAVNGHGTVWPWEICVWRCQGGYRSGSRTKREGQRRTDRCHLMHCGSTASGWWCRRLSPQQRHLWNEAECLPLFCILWCCLIVDCSKSLPAGWLCCVWC